MRLYPNGAVAAHVLGGARFGEQAVNAAEIIGVAGIEAEFDEEEDAAVVDCDDFEALVVFSGFFISLMFRMEGNKVDMFLEWEDVLSFPDIVFQLDTSLLGVLVCSGGVSGSDNLDPVRVGDLHENSAAFGFLGRYRPDDTLPLLLLLDRCEEC